MSLRYLNKLTKILIIVSSIFLLWFPFATSTSSAAPNNNELILKKSTITISNFSNANSAEEKTTVLSDAKKTALKKVIDKITKKKTKDKGIDLKSLSQSNLISSLAPGQIPIGTVTFEYKLTGNPSTKMLTSSVKILSVVGVPPISLSGSQFPEYDSYENSWMHWWYWDDIFDNLAFAWYGPEIHAGQSASQSFPAETQWWDIFGEVTADWSNGTSDSVDYETPQQLVNKNAVEFPDYVDSLSGERASKGVRTDWVEVPVDQRVIWDGTERQKAIAAYIDKYKNPGYNWSQGQPNYKQLHHIKPRLYGGDNSLDNLIPIGEPEHILISSWFKAYGTSANPDDDNF